MTIPKDWLPPALMQRIICHWTAGAHNASATDKAHYHLLVQGDGTLARGKPSIQANEAPAKAGYAAHTLNCNSGSIGVSMCCMAGAVERPFKSGKSPMTRVQYDAFVEIVAELCERYDIPVTPKTVLSHAEVQTTLKIQQRGKWDFTRFAFEPSLDGALVTGARLRADVLAAMKGTAALPIVVENPEGALLDTGVVSASVLVLRDHPSGSKVGSMPRGTRLLIHGRSGAWSNIQTPFGARGWASSRHIQTL